MKKVGLFFALLLVVCMSMTMVVDLYTTEQADNLANAIVGRYSPSEYLMEYNYSDKSWVYVKEGNKYIKRSDVVAPFLWYDLANANSDVYSYSEWVNWKVLLANNPSLAYKALDLYGKRIIRQINSRTLYKAEKYPSTYNEIDFTLSKFWKSQIRAIGKYQRLVRKLLSLSDEDLDYYISTNTDDASSYEFNQWLKSNDLLYVDNMGSNINYQTSNDYGRYPGDLLLLTRRVTMAYPQWTAREFLTEVKKFSDEVLEKIEDYN